MFVQLQSFVLWDICRLLINVGRSGVLVDFTRISYISFVEDLFCCETETDHMQLVNINNLLNCCVTLDRFLLYVDVRYYYLIINATELLIALVKSCCDILTNSLQLYV